MKNVKGITLISLVVTIVVLLILAGITINLVLTDGGIFNKAEQAEDEYNKGEATDVLSLKILNVQIEKYAEEQKRATLKELADNFCEDDDFSYVDEVSKMASLTKIDNENPSSIYVILKAYPYEFEINDSLQIASIDGVKMETIPGNQTNTNVEDYTENMIFKLDLNNFDSTERDRNTWNRNNCKC